MESLHSIKYEMAEFIARNAALWDPAVVVYIPILTGFFR